MSKNHYQGYRAQPNLNIKSTANKTSTTTHPSEETKRQYPEITKNKVPYKYRRNNSSAFAIYTVLAFMDLDFIPSCI